MKIYFVSADEKKIENKDFIVVKLYEENSNKGFYVYKIKSNEYLNLFTHLKKWDDITSRVSLAIKSNGKITLDIK